VKILHVVGARPNFMKVAPVQRALSLHAGCTQVLIHTGQHYDDAMSEIFFKQLDIPRPDHNLCVGENNHEQQILEIIFRLEPIILQAKPDVVFVYGDVTSTIATALVCNRLKIAIAHVESGLRSFDQSMPEEINRIVTDQLSSYLFTPSFEGNENLIREHIDPKKIHFVGNVMIDTLIHALPLTDSINVLKDIGINAEEYALVTLHRPSNVDRVEDLNKIIIALNNISRRIPVIFPVHPRTLRALRGLEISRELHLIDPVGYLEFLSLQRRAVVVITDSGGVQEETTYLNVPCLTVRENTERPVTVTIGTNTIVGRDMTQLCSEVDLVLVGRGKSGVIPPLWDGCAGSRIASIFVE
jgi:UDP-N-acetylglucosamine 2-epimerase (non-hydrolysing)